MCPVQVYKEFLKRRPSDSNLPESRFYLKPILQPKSSVWFSRQPSGINSIGNIAKKMTIQGGLSSVNKSNHSGRKTAIQTLLHADVSPTDVIQLSGHKNVQSLNSYSHLSTNQQQNVSKIISEKICVPSTNNLSNALPIVINNSNDNEVIDDATMNEMLCERSPENDYRLNVTETIRNVSSGDSVCHSHVSSSTKVTSPKISMLNGTINGNITININYNRAKQT
jgi:hypothetical protein